MVPVRTSMDGRRILHQLRRTRRAILQFIERQRTSPDDVKTIKALLKTFEACDRPPEEMGVVRDIVAASKRSERLSTNHALHLIELISGCEQDVRAFLQASSKMDVELLPEFRQKEEAYVEELISMIGEGEGQPSERIRDLTKELIFRRPGQYISEIHQTLMTGHFREISYPSVWFSVHQLQDEADIVTIGGPQGKRRYCFPNPELLASKEEYYGLPFPLLGSIEAEVTDDFIHTRANRLRDLFIVGSNSPSETLLVIDFLGTAELEVGTQIKSFGSLETFDYVVSREGLDPSNGVDELDVVLGMKVAVMVDGIENEIWFDRAIETKKSLYA